MGIVEDGGGVKGGAWPERQIIGMQDLVPFDHPINVAAHREGGHGGHHIIELRWEETAAGATVSLGWRGWAGGVGLVGLGDWTRGVGLVGLGWWGWILCAHPVL